MPSRARSESGSHLPRQWAAGGSATGWGKAGPTRCDAQPLRGKSCHSCGCRNEAAALDFDSHSQARLPAGQGRPTRIVQVNKRCSAVWQTHLQREQRVAHSEVGARVFRLHRNRPPEGAHCLLIVPTACRGEPAPGEVASKQVCMPVSRCSSALAGLPAAQVLCIWRPQSAASTKRVPQ